jgi:phosphoribosylaminoimidazole-succinocarboxamide synthase
MKLTYTGKTKDVYALEDGNYLLQFKDDVTGENGVFDPGANTVGLTLEGAGRAGLNEILFEDYRKKILLTILMQISKNLMMKPAEVFGKSRSFVVIIAVGSFLRRWLYTEGQTLDLLLK